MNARRVAALYDVHGNLPALRERGRALCERRPLYPGFRGYTTYVA